MSSSINKTPKKQSAVYIRDDKVFVAPTKLNKTIINNITSLSTYNSKNPLNQHMINLVQHMYKARDITNFKTAKTALVLFTSSNDINKFQTLFTKKTQLTTKKTYKVKLKTNIKQQTNTAVNKEIINKVEKSY